MKQKESTINHCKLSTIKKHSELEQTLCKTNWSMRSDSARVSRAIVGTTPIAQANPRIQVFWKNSIFHFLEP